jgi:predicted kinase
VDPLEQDVACILAALDPLPQAHPRPALVVLSGLPGSGKSTVAHALREWVHAAVVQSDVVRKLLFPVPHYTSEESVWVFTAIHRAVEQLLRRHVSVILDATNLEERHRRSLEEIAKRAGARPLLVWVEASEREIRRRLIARHRGNRASNDVSDADVAVYEELRRRVEPIRGEHLVIRTDRDFTPEIERLVRIVNETSPPTPLPRGEGSDYVVV